MHLKCTLDYISAFLQSLKYKLVGIPSKSLYAEVIFFIFFWKPISSLQVRSLSQNIYQMQRMLKELFCFLSDKNQGRWVGQWQGHSSLPPLTLPLEIALHLFEVETGWIKPADCVFYFHSDIYKSALH